VRCANATCDRLLRNALRSHHDCRVSGSRDDSNAGSFDVVVSGFDRRTEPTVQGLQRVFGLDQLTAEALVRELPVVVQRGVNRVRAEHYQRALLSIGARVTLKDRERLATSTDAANSVPLMAAETALPATRAEAERAADRDSSAPAVVATNAFQAASATTLLSSAQQPANDLEPLWLPAMRPELAATLISIRPPQPKKNAVQARAGWGELQRPHAAAALLGQHARERSGGARVLSAAPESELLDPLQLASLPPNQRARGQLAISAQLSAHVVPLVFTPAQGAARPVWTRSPNPIGQLAGAARVSTPPSAAVDTDCEPTFWQALPETLLFSCTGSGPSWLISIAIWAAAASLLAAGASVLPMVGTSVTIFSNTAVLALCADYHRLCMWAVINAEPTLDEGPDFDPVRILQGYVRSGVQLSLFAVLCQLPLVLWLVPRFLNAGSDGFTAVLHSPMFWFLAAAPAFYWPMAVTTASLYNRYAGVWYVPVGMRAIARAPLEYLAICAIGGLACLLPLCAFLLLGKLIGLPSVLLAACSGFPLALSHGVMGALTGQLMRNRPDLF
jgi:hypothetical protein